MLTVVPVLALALVGATTAASAGTSSLAGSWDLQDFDRAQRVCVQYGAGDGTHRSYLIFAVTGSWSTDLDFGMRDLPPGWVATQGRLPSGSNHPDPDDGGVLINGWIHVQGPSSVPQGTYHPRIRVSDGSTTETTPVEVVVTTASWLDCMQARG
ncbi:DUF5980 family protein [Actinosynnema sp. NPDC053489]|uniref:DUF5980 family protein n=1 Tax=Actinosynnema sp. NPDC053489 TaxID=3363916 RepID=UPI0037CC89E2